MESQSGEYFEAGSKASNQQHHQERPSHIQAHLLLLCFTDIVTFFF